MLIAIPDLLDHARLARVRALVTGAEWVDGNVTSGHQSALAKDNAQLPEGSAAAVEAGDIVLAARSAYFYLPFMPRLGIVPDLGCTWAIPRRAGV